MTKKDYITYGTLALIVVTIGVVGVIVVRRNKKKNMTTGEVEKTWDASTDKMIQTLHPKLRAIASKFINEVQKKLGYKLRIASGYRSIDEQNRLYAQGRTTAGGIVTKAKGGSSYHNYGLAFDTYFTDNGKTNLVKTITPDVVAIGKSLGLEWGGDWKTIKDMPHFQLTLAPKEKLLSLYNNKKVDSNGYVIV